MLLEIDVPGAVLDQRIERSIGLCSPGQGTGRNTINQTIPSETADAPMSTGSVSLPPRVASTETKRMQDQPAEDTTVTRLGQHSLQSQSAGIHSHISLLITWGKRPSNRRQSHRMCAHAMHAGEETAAPNEIQTKLIRDGRQAMAWAEVNTTLLAPLPLTPLAET